MQTLAQRRSLGILGVLALLASLVMVIAGPASAATFSEGNCNEQNGWDQNVASGPWGTITNNGDGSVSATLNPGYTLELCVKGGSGYFVYNVPGGISGPYWPPANCGQGQNQCGLSHWAIRNVTFTTTTTTTAAPTTTTTTAPTTTTTAPPTTTTVQQTTTTAAPTTTTTVQQTTTTAAPTTTTTVQQSTTTAAPTTTTTVQQSTTTAAPTTTTTVPFTTTTGGQPTTTTAAPTTTTAPATTSTAGVGVAGIQVSAPVAAQVTQATLPFTGISTTSMAVVAAGLAAMGLLLLAVSRRSEEKDSARSWS